MANHLQAIGKNNFLRLHQLRWLIVSLATSLRTSGAAIRITLAETIDTMMVENMRVLQILAVKGGPYDKA